MRVLGRIGTGAIVGCVVALISSISAFALASEPVPSQLGLEAGLLFVALVVIALVGGSIVGSIASIFASTYLFKEAPWKALVMSAATGLLFAPVGLYFAGSLSPSCKNCQLLSGHTNSVHAVAFSPDGRFLVSAGEDRTVIVRETDNMQAIATRLGAHQAMITDLAFSADGQTLVSADYRGVIYVWNMNKLSEPSNRVFSFNGLGDVAISPDGQYIAAVSAIVDDLFLWAIGSEEPGRVSVENVGAIAFAPEGNRIAAITGNEALFYTIPDLRQEEDRLCCLSLDNGEMLREIAFSPMGNAYAIAVSDYVYLWTALKPSGEPTTLHPQTEDNILSIAISPDGRYLAVGSSRIFIWDLLDLDLPPIVLEDTGYVFSLSFDATSRYLAAGGPHPQVSVYDVNEFR